MRGRITFAVCELGQELIEYTLLLAFLGLGSAAMLLNLAGSANPIWNTSDSHLKKGHAYGQGHGTGEPDKPDKSQKP
jgi:hypothetical protein